MLISPMDYDLTIIIADHKMSKLQNFMPVDNTRYILDKQN